MVPVPIEIIGSLAILAIFSILLNFCFLYYHTHYNRPTVKKFTSGFGFTMKRPQTVHRIQENSMNPKILETVLEIESETMDTKKIPEVVIADISESILTEDTEILEVSVTPEVTVIENSEVTGKFF